MQRRRYLAVTSAALAGLAGCTGGDDTEEMETPTPESDDTPESGDTPTDTPEPEDTPTDTPEDDDTPTDTPEPSGEPDIVRAGDELVVDETDYGTDVWVAATVENEGDAPSGQVKLNVEWYDGDDNYLGDATGRLYSLGAGETWTARVDHLGSGAEDVADYELEGEFETEPLSAPDEITLLDSEMNVGDQSVDVTGQVENGYDSEFSYLEVGVKLYDDDGNVLGSEWTNETDIPAGTTWQFDVTWYDSGRVEQVADHEIVLDDSAL